MTTWKATIKEVGNDHLLTPTYSFSELCTFGYTGEQSEDELARQFLIKFWGLDKPDVEWYKLEKIK